jgi:shikimate kinase
LKLAAQKNIILIGMPGAGKSTLGVLLAKELTKGFVDTDLLIQEHAGKSLQAILDQQGYLALRAMEEDVLCRMDSANCVIATGGSAVYSESAMSRLKQDGVCIYLRLSLTSVQGRVHNLDSRGIAAADGQSLADVYTERQPLYEHYADFTIECDNKSIEEVLGELQVSSDKLQGKQ